MTIKQLLVSSMQLFINISGTARCISHREPNARHLLFFLSNRKINFSAEALKHSIFIQSKIHYWRHFGAIC